MNKLNATDICNMALSYVGKGRIDSFNDATEEAKQCKIHYDHCRRRLLLAYPWGFAKRIEQLAPLEETVPGWKYCYGYPAECISVQFVYDELHAKNKEMEPQDYEIVMKTAFYKVIASDVGEAYAEYIYNVKEPEVFSDEFIEALAHLLAGSIAMSITGSATIRAQELQLAQQCTEAAKYQSVIEKARRTQYPRKYARERFK